jgi:hypothetical protein
MPDNDTLAKRIAPFIQNASKKFPHYPQNDPEKTWDELYLRSSEAQLYAYAALDALEKLGYEIKKKAK